ncbi:oxidoreductase [Embleya hyalina]|uniref:Probable nitronate monooxygenase n=2 Tax=Embleya hyalina TaxID=516124 RepID=A0A401YPD9_9ACTN|nr:oxidoreductase [Embleya hyalina]
MMPTNADPTRLTELPIVQAPMAGASGPALAAAVGRAGGLGFLAAGYRSAAALGAEIEELRSLLGDVPFGVNAFMPQPPPTRAEDELTARYARSLARAAARYGGTVGTPAPGVERDDWDAKLDLLLARPVPVVSFTFGLPDIEAVAALRAAGTLTVATVTTPQEARLAVAHGVDALCVQGGEAGGHQGSFDNPAAPAPYGLLTLLTLIAAETDLPLIAAGGLMTGRQIEAVRLAGASAAQLGTAFLRGPESVASTAHKAALGDPAFERSVLTRAFSGRWARGLYNGFAARHEAEAPGVYPYVHHLVAPIRKAAAARGEADGLALWAGQGWRLAREEPAAEVIHRLVDEMAAARKACA